MNKNILLGITGGIAAYKMVEVASTLTKMGNNVRVIMTKNATKFISPMTFAAITGNKVDTDFFDANNNDAINHISLAEDADLILVAPVTANSIARIAHGMADDLLTGIILATKADILLSPAMNVNMYKNDIVQENIKYLMEKGFKIIEPDSGYLACGTHGEGRLPAPEVLVEYVIKGLKDKKLKNRNVLITAGPTREPLDPVRFLSNYSSGKMGYALAKSAWYQGANVTIISGPVHLTPPPEVKLIEVETAVEMNKEVSKHIDDFDIIFMVAAVADYRPKQINKEKIKKDEHGELVLDLSKNPDILNNIGKNKKNNQLFIGFAAESQNLVTNAREKLFRKKLDMIVANDISKSGLGFGSDKNEVYLITEDKKRKLPVMKKTELAEEIIDEIIKL